jgi:hypothetical protein
MLRRYKPHIPQTIDDVVSQLGFMLLKSPTFVDPFFPGRNVETAFLQLNGGLRNVRKELGEERFHTLMALSDKVRAHFEADPQDNNGESMAGRQLIQEMQEILERV